MAESVSKQTNSDTQMQLCICSLIKTNLIKYCASVKQLECFREHTEFLLLLERASKTQCVCHFTLFGIALIAGE